jgi:hypothetical protein
MIQYRATGQTIKTANGSIVDSSFTTAGSKVLFTGGILLLIYVKISNYTATWQTTNNPLLSLSFGSGTGADQALRFITNSSTFYGTIYPAPTLADANANYDSNTSGSASIIWPGVVGFVSIGSIINYRAYYINQPTL